MQLCRISAKLILLNSYYLRPMASAKSEVWSISLSSRNRPEYSSLAISLFLAIMRDVLVFLLAVKTLAQACTEAMKGDRHCDQVCMTANADFDSSNGVSDCREMCLGHCSESSSCQASCLTWDCAWGEGKCGECAAGCEKAWLGNGQCEAACNVEKCSFDAGDCSTSSSPNTAYVSARSASSGDGSWAAPFPSLAPALESLWLPFNSVYLLAGSHLLYPISSSSLLTNEVLTETVIATLFCNFQPKDHLQCATSRAVIQLTAQFTSFTVQRTP